MSTPSRGRLFSESQDSSLSVFIRVSCYMSFCASSMYSTLLGGVQALAVLLGCKSFPPCCAAALLNHGSTVQTRNQCNTRYPAICTMAWCVSASKAAQSYMVVLSNRPCSLLNIKRHRVNSLTCIKISSPAADLAPRVWCVLYQQR